MTTSGLKVGRVKIGFLSLVISITYASSCKKDVLTSQPGITKTGITSVTKPDSNSTAPATAKDSSRVTTTAAPIVRQHLLFENTFENSDALTLWATEEKANDNSITLSNLVARHGHYSLRSLLHKTDSTVNDGKRAEVTLKPEAIVKVERWVGFSVYLPASFIVDPDPEIIQQWHDMPDLADGGVWRSPPFALSTQNGRWQLTIRWSAARLTNNATSFFKTYDLGAYRNSFWIDWVFHIRWSWDNDGLIEVWKSGKLIQTINGPNAYNDIVGNYFKMGIYKWVWMPGKDTGQSTTTNREVYYDDVRIGDEHASYKDVAPE